MKPKAQVPIPSPIREAAASWRALQDAGLDAKQEIEFTAWLESDERHSIAFSEISTTWSTFSQLQANRPAGEPNPDLLAPSQTATPGQNHFWRNLGWAAVAAAAVIAIGFAVWPKSAPTPAPAITLSEQSGEKRELPDGSVVQMNSSTAISVDYVVEERRVRLIHGEAHFTVAKNPDRPFVVITHNIAIRAVGTAFNVQETARAVRVLVTEGKVQVRDTGTAKSLLPPTAAAETVLYAGQEAVIPLSGAAIPDLSEVAPPEVVKKLGWREPRLEFVDVPLSRVVAEFNRLNEHQLVIGDPELANVRFGGGFAPQAQDAFVRLLEVDFGITAERQADRTILRRRPH